MNNIINIIRAIKLAIYPRDQFCRYLTQTLDGPKWVGGTPPRIAAVDAQPEATTPPKSPAERPVLKIYRG